MATLASRSLKLADSESIIFLNFTLAADDTPRTLHQYLNECESKVGLANVARQTFFVPDHETRTSVQNVLDEIYGEALPPTTFVLQAPIEGGSVAAEIWAFATPGALSRKSGVTTLDAGGAHWGFIGGIEDPGKTGPEDSAINVLTQANQRFSEAEKSFEDSVRLWYYIGDILGTHDQQSRYGLFNHARNQFYRDKWPDLCLSPASTGIGMLSHSIVFEGLAMQGHHEDYACVWLDNPLQTPPYEYKIDLKKYGQTPSFSRAAAVRLKDVVLIFISGTASVRKSEVLDPNNIVEQTKNTLDNIATLIGTENMTRYGFSRGAELTDILQYRVYTKRAEDMKAVRDVCNARLPGIPHVQTVADVCWPQFLTEIEGVAAIPVSA